MRLWLQRHLRAFSLWLYGETAMWVVPEEVHLLTDEGRYEEATLLLEERRKLWGIDPEIITAQASISFLAAGVFDDLEDYDA